jgi:VWFA-related protein
MKFHRIAMGALALAALSAAAQSRSSSPAQQSQSAPAPAQGPSATTTQSAPLRVATRLVQVSVVVHDKKGNPITGLTKDDFVVLDEKKPQQIESFSMETSAPPTTEPPRLPPDTYTNRIRERAGVPTSITVILLDGLNTKFENQSQARSQVIKFLETIQPEDHVAIYSLGHSLRVLQDFTNDSASLLAVLAKYRGEHTPMLDASTAEVADTGNATADEFLNNAFQREADYMVRDRVLRTVDALTQIANHVGVLPGRKNLIWVSGSFPFSLGYAANRTDDPGVTNLPDDLMFFNEEIRSATRALTNANLAVYPVDARGLIAGDLGNQAASANPFGGSRTAAASSRGSRNSDPFPMPDQENFTTMNSLANQTGGKAFYNTNDLLHSIREAVDDSRVTYEIGYYPAGINWNGGFHTIKVEVKKPDAKVRSREGYFALPEPKLTPQDRKSLIAATSTSPLEATQIGVVAQVTGFSMTGERSVKLAVAIDPHEFRFEQKDGRWTDNVDAVYVELDDKGQIAHVLDETYKLSFDDARFQSLLKQGIRFPKEVPIVAGAIQLRVIVRDATTGNIGDTIIPLAKYFPPN